MLETNSLGGEKRSLWYDCGNWQLGAFTQYYAPSRQVETDCRMLGGRNACHLTVIKPVDFPRRLKQELAIDAFSALAQPTRLEAFRLLVKQEPDGLPAGEIARAYILSECSMTTTAALAGS